MVALGSPITPHLRRYLTLFRRWFWLLGLCALVAALGALLVSNLQPPTYRATALLIVDQSAPGQDVYSGLLASDQLVATYEHMITQPVVLQRAARSAGGISAAQLAQRVSVNDQPSTQIIEVDVEDGNPDRAARLANAIVDSFIAVQQQSADAELAAALQRLAPQITAVSDQIRDLNTTLAQLKAENPDDPRIPGIEQQLTSALAERDSLQTLSTQLTTQRIVMADSLHVFQPAIPPSAPDRPKPLLNAAIGALLGLLLASGFVFLMELFDERIRTPAQVEELVGIPVIGSIRGDRPNRLLLSGNPSAHTLGAYEQVRTNLSLVALDQPLRTIVVTSAKPGEGKSTIALNLATSLARSGKRTLLIDADLHHASLHGALDAPDKGGLSLCLAVENPRRLIGDGPQAAFIHVDDRTPNLHILPAGPTPPNPAELLQSDKMRDLLRFVLSDEAGSNRMDVVVIDTPPATSFVDAAVLAGRADGTIFVIDATRSRKGPVYQALDALRRANARIVGVVLNRTSAPQQSYSSQRYGGQDNGRARWNAIGADGRNGALGKTSDQGVTNAAERDSPYPPRGTSPAGSDGWAHEDGY
jgi:capsular exopolysaccharide synthesis family protein